MKTLCLGGSFNPIHHGHLICARAVAESRGFERIMLIPSGQPPHKPDTAELADGRHRFRMCQLAANMANSSFHGPSHVIVEVSDLELTRTGPSYTLDTVRALRQNGWQHVFWLIGGDMLNYLPKWHKYEELIKETEFVVVARPFVEIHWASLPGELALYQDKLVPAPLVEISSTQIRHRIRNGLGIEYLTPQPVVDYISQQKLYCRS